MIRIGVAKGHSAPQIAAFLGRHRQAVYKKIKAMEAEGTLGCLPFSFIADEIGEAIANAKR